MRRALWCVSLVAVIVWAHAIVCPPNICDSIECDESLKQENCNEPMKLFKPNGGFCGCCPLCVTIIPQGGSCLSIRGVPSTWVCIEGTYCYNETCQPF